MKTMLETRDGPKSSTTVMIDTGTHLVQMTVWATGETDIEWADIAARDVKRAHFER